MTEPAARRRESLFHWSPTCRRKQIVRYGLRPGMWSTDRLWRAPYVALSWSPSLAWGLSGMTARGAEHATWDLWTVYADCLDGFDTHIFEDQELRVFQRIYERDVWYVATRNIEEHP